MKLILFFNVYGKDEVISANFIVKYKKSEDYLTLVKLFNSDEWIKLEVTYSLFLEYVEIV